MRAFLALDLLGFGLTAQAAEISAVGFVNATEPQGYSLIANPLSDQANRVDQVIPSPPTGTQLIKFDGWTWLTNEFAGGFWTMPEMVLAPGEAALLRSPESWIHTWAGSLLQGELKVLIPAGISLRSSPIPQAGKLSEVLQFPKIVGTRIQRADNSGRFVLWATCTETGWEPEEPTLKIGEGFHVEAPREFIWDRAFAFDGQSPTATAIRIIAQPQSQPVSLGETVSLSVEAASTNALSYQWQLNGNDIPDADQSTLVIGVNGSEHLGSYWVKVWDHRSWHWSDIARIQLAGSPLPRLTISQDSQGRGVLLSPQWISGPAPTIETSTDLIHWVPLAGAEPIDANSVLARFSGPQNARFYRLK